MLHFKLSLIYISFILSIPDGFMTEESHELEKLGWQVRCRLQPNGFDCSKNKTSESRFYYDIAMQACRTFEYAQCDLSFNTFYTLHECIEQCQVIGGRGISEPLTRDVYCRLQSDFGGCTDYFPMWYFDVSERRCKGFSYSGCGGNGNRFLTAHQCTEGCASVVLYPKNGVFIIE